MSMEITQRNATRNQSTADFEHKKIFLFDNRFVEGVFKNTSGAILTLQAGMLVNRSATVANGLIPTTVDNVVDNLGICAIETPMVLQINQEININYCSKGTIDGTKLSLPATVTLNTVPADSNKTVRDILEDLGLHVDISATEHTKFDN